MTASKSVTVSHAAPSAELPQSNPNAPATSVIFQKPPPPNAFIPTPPSGFVPATDSIFLGFMPRLVELGALPGAVEDLKNFLDYAAILGVTAPPIAEVLAALEMAAQWSTMRKASSIWDVFATMQEGIAWATLRPLMDKLRPAFALAASHNASLPSKFSSLNTLLTAKQAIARKGASTRALNKQAVADGKPPIHGKSGKRRKKAADKAIVAAADAAKAATSESPPTPTAPIATATLSTPAASLEQVSTSSNGAIGHA